MLSDDKIIELIHIKTYAYLVVANYSVLRQHCLEQRALPVILEQIQSDVGLLIENEKREYIATQLSIASSRQQQQDTEENRHDAEEAEIERRLCIRLDQELTDINDELELVRQEKNKQEELLNKLSPLIDILSKQIHLLEAAKSSHEYSHSENGHKNTQHKYSDQQTNQEHAPPNTTRVHNHPHSLHPPAHKELITTPPLVSAEAYSQLILQKELMEFQYNAARKKFEDCSCVIQKLTQKRCALNVKMTSEIPQKQQARRERLSARQLRESARLNQESIQTQLSPQNYLLLFELIHKFNALKEYQGKQTISTAEKYSYSEYINCLINALRMNQAPRLNFYEITSLKQIAQLMQKCLGLADEVRDKRATLKAEQETKWGLDNILSNNEEELLGLQRANPMLTNQNSRFDEDNRKLAQTISARLQDRNQLLKIGAGILLLTLITALLAFIGGLELIFFTPSALCATITLGLFVTSLIYTAQNNSDRYQLKQNQINITKNSQKISTQTEQISNLEKIIIPELKIQISQAHIKIEKLKQKIEELQKVQELYRSKANQVTLSKTNNIYPNPSTSPELDLEERSFDKNYSFSSDTDHISYRL
ncbi:hypothetical protein [Legionella rowbothamii]|uniref:hypothetical protein n=1 Tax=Legionella rowbothamii TaxID=96229 RepID=UPI001055ED95|nr:hypothetical protein [Legionella rowbothamii]